MTVTAVDTPPPTKAHDTGRHERPAAARHVETPRPNETHQAPHAARAEPRGKTVNVHA